MAGLAFLSAGPSRVAGDFVAAWDKKLWRGRPGGPSRPGTRPVRSRARDAGTRLEWIDELDRLDALEPRSVVAGHKIPDHDDDPRNIAETRQYLRDFIRLDQMTDTPARCSMRDQG